MEAIVRVLGSDRWRRVLDVRSYLFRCVVNETRSRHRSSQRREARERSFVTAGGRDDNPQVRIDVLDAVGRLSPRQRAVIYLTYWLDTDTETAASTLGVSVRTIERELTRSRQILESAAAMIDLDSEIRRAMGELSEAAPVPPSVASFESMIEQPDRSNHRFVAGLAAAAVIVLGLGGVWASVAVRGNPAAPVDSGPASNDRDNHADRSTTATTLTELVAPALPAGFRCCTKARNRSASQHSTHGVWRSASSSIPRRRTSTYSMSTRTLRLLRRQLPATSCSVWSVSPPRLATSSMRLTELLRTSRRLSTPSRSGFDGDTRQAILDRDQTSIDTRSLFNDVDAAMKASLGELVDDVEIRHRHARPRSSQVLVRGWRQSCGGEPRSH